VLLAMKYIKELYRENQPNGGGKRLSGKENGMYSAGDDCPD
jgi:hypothetical protein